MPFLLVLHTFVFAMNTTAHNVNLLITTNTAAAITSTAATATKISRITTTFEIIVFEFAAKKYDVVVTSAVGLHRV